MSRGLSWRRATCTVVDLAFLSAMAACLLRVAGLPSVIVQRSRPTTAGLGGSFRRHVALPSSRALRPRDISGNSSSRVQARKGFAALRMASELSKTAISTMRVKELREELENRGLSAAGIRPVLQARLGEAAETERSGKASSPPRHRTSSSRSSTNSRTCSSEFGSSRESVRRSPRAMSTLASGQALPPTRSGSAMYVMQFDGGSRGNPGPSGAGAVLYRLGGNGRREEVWCGSIWVGPERTSNEAEYSGLIEGLRAAKELGIKKLAVEGDSKLVIQQMLGKFKVSSPKMRPLFNKAKDISGAFEELNLSHIKRDLNGRADSLANIAMDTRESSSVVLPGIDLP